MTKKIIVLILSATAFFFLWFNGLENIYAYIIAKIVNLLLISDPGTYLTLDLSGNHAVFNAHVIINGRAGTYPQSTEDLFLLPLILILTWAVLSFFYLKWKTALISFLINFGVFLIAQVVFMLLLLNYYTSETAKFAYDLMMDSFSIIALLLIIIDNVRNRIF